MKTFDVFADISRVSLVVLHLTIVLLFVFG